jgi:flagellar motor switch protein FliN
VEQPPAATRTLRVLIVSSDSAQAAALTEVVKNCGGSAESAEDLRSTTFWLGVEEFQAMLYLDSTPSTLNPEALKRLQRDHPSLHVLVLTRNVSSPVAILAAQAGAKVVPAAPGDYARLYPELAAIQTEAESRPKVEAPRRTTVHPIQLPTLQPGNQTHPRAGVDMVMDVPVTINAVLGHRNLLISELLGLGPGSVVELNKRAGEPIDLYVNDRLIANGEVVVVNDTYGILITGVLDEKQRINALGQ